MWRFLLLANALVIIILFWNIVLFFDKRIELTSPFQCNDPYLKKWLSELIKKNANLQKLSMKMLMCNGNAKKQWSSIMYYNMDRVLKMTKTEIMFQQRISIFVQLQLKKNIRWSILIHALINIKQHQTNNLLIIFRYQLVFLKYLNLVLVWMINNLCL